MIRNEMRDKATSHFSKILNAVSPGWIAGGCLRDFFSGEPIKSDVDVFFKNIEQYNHVKRELIRQSHSVKGLAPVLVYDTENFKDESSPPDNRGLSMFVFGGFKVQLIGTVFFSDQEELANAFDFTICCASLSTSSIVVHEHFFEDLAARRLMINKLPFPISTLKRLVKYTKYGYTACDETLLRLAEALRFVNLNDPIQNSIEFYFNGDPRFVGFD